MDIIENKVANSGIISLDLADFKATKTLSLDIADFLDSPLLREKPFRDAIKNYDWTKFRDTPTTLFCSMDAIIPQWAWMLLSSYLVAEGATVFYGKTSEASRYFLLENIRNIDLEAYRDKRVIVKGCGELVDFSEGFSLLTQKLQPVVKSLMFGEACSSVPIYKKK